MKVLMTAETPERMARAYVDVYTSLGTTRSYAGHGPALGPPDRTDPVATCA